MKKSSIVAGIRDCLATIGPGKVPDGQVHELELLLSRCWNYLAGSGGGGMANHKLIGRTEEMDWRPPALSFSIERHAALVHGSSRAEVQQWRVDLNRETAELVGARRRQKRPMAQRLDVKPIAAEIAAFINDGRENAHLKWGGTSRVRVILSEVIPATNRQTTSSRRKRFAAELERLLLAGVAKAREAISFSSDLAIHDFLDFTEKSWMTGPNPVMTEGRWMGQCLHRLVLLSVMS